MNTRRISVVLFAGAALAACGDDNSEPTMPPPMQTGNDVPASAYASTVAYSNYAATLPLTDTGEPLRLGPTAAPTSETEEPVQVK
jgi:hypothetical protein